MADVAIPYLREFQYAGRSYTVYGDELKSFYPEIDLFYLMRHHGLRRRHLRWLGNGQRTFRTLVSKNGTRRGGFVISHDALPNLVRRYNNIPAEIYNHLGLDRADFVEVVPEADIKKKFLSAFRGERIMTTLKVQGHRVDMYFPQYNVVVDFALGKKEERGQRRAEIVDELGCEYFVVDSTRRKFDIFEEIGDLMSLINRRRNGNYALAIFAQAQPTTGNALEGGAKLNV